MAAVSRLWGFLTDEGNRYASDAAGVKVEEGGGGMRRVVMPLSMLTTLLSARRPAQVRRRRGAPRLLQDGHGTLARARTAKADTPLDQLKAASHAGCAAAVFPPDP